MADFTDELTNFESQLWECYRRFIERVRREITNGRYSHNHPVTPIEVNPPTQFFDLLLATNDHNIRVRFRRDNLYLIGYQMQDTNQWLELRYNKNDHVHRIPNAERLSFGERYDDLRSAAGVDALNDINAGRQEFIRAINALATTTNDRTRARSLIVLTVMISESLRFEQITTYFGDLFTSAAIPNWIQSYLNGWADLSAALLHTDWDNTRNSDDTGNAFQLPAINNFAGIRTVASALAIIGIMKGYNWPRRQLRVADDEVHNSDGAGRPLVELFSMKIDNIHGNQHSTIGDIYGTIKVSDGLGPVYMYNRKPNVSEYVHMKNTISLNSPPRCISAFDDFNIDVTLMCKNGLSEDDEISKGQIYCEVTYLNEYDKLLFKEIKGKFGAATLCYAILRDAVVATVEVTLISENRGRITNVYGLLTSHNVVLNSETVLLEKAANKSVNVKPGEVIPLSRSVVAVPLCSNFIIRADLNGANILASNNEIAKGTATFIPNFYGTDEQTISGDEYNHIRVKVSWSWYV